MLKWLFDKQRNASQTNDNSETAAAAAPDAPAVAEQPAPQTQPEVSTAPEVQETAAIAEAAPEPEEVTAPQEPAEPEPVVEAPAEQIIASAEPATTTPDEPAPGFVEAETVAPAPDPIAPEPELAVSPAIAPVSPPMPENITTEPETVALMMNDFTPSAPEGVAKLKVGDTVIAAHPPRYDEVEVLDIQAGGRRVIIGYGNATRAYSLRKDNSYRLEGAPDNSPSELVTDKSIDELKPIKGFATLPAAASLSEGTPAFVAAPEADNAQPEVAVRESVQTPSVSPVQNSASWKPPGQSSLDPVPGATAIAVAPPRYDEVKIVEVQAGGRRVIVGVGNGTRVYSRRQDGSYRLEGAPKSSAARLVLDKSIEEIKQIDRNGGVARYGYKAAM